MSEQPTLEIFEDWEPPQLSEEASIWLLSQLTPQVFSRFAQAVQQEVISNRFQVSQLEGGNQEEDIGDKVKTVAFGDFLFAKSFPESTK